MKIKNRILSFMLGLGLTSSMFPSSMINASSKTAKLYNTKDAILDAEKYNLNYDTNNDGVLNVFDAIRARKEVVSGVTYSELEDKVKQLEQQVEILLERLTKNEKDVNEKVDNEHKLVGSLVDKAFDEKEKFEAEISENMDTKVDKEEGKGLSSNDFTDEDKSTLEKINSEISDLKSDLNLDDVYVGTDRKFKSILSALKSGAKTIYVESGTYDIYQEYLDYYGSDFWQNYDGYSGNDDSDCFLRGLWLDYGVKVIGSGDVVLTFLHDTSFNSKIQTEFSIFACKSNVQIKNITIEVDHNCRYHIHDDFMAKNGIVEFRNIIFKGVPHVPVCIGAGLGIDVTYDIANCVFLDDETATYDISYHGNTANVQTKSKIFVSNCSGNSNLAFRWYGTSQLVTECYVSNCRFKNIECKEYNTEQPYENMALTEWCNETTN